MKHVTLLVLSCLTIPLVGQADPCANPPVNAVALTDVQITSGPFVVDADGALGVGWNTRDKIQVRTEVDIVYTSGDPQNYRVQLLLLDAGDAAAPMAGGDVFATFTVDGSSPATLVSFTLLDPDAALVANGDYRVRAILQREVALCAGSSQIGAFWENVAGERADSAVGQFFHFTNTTSGDEALNAFVDVDAAALVRNVALAPVLGLEAFPVEVEYALHRYDGFNEVPQTDAVPVRVTLELRDGSGVPLTLAQGQFVDTEDVQSHGLGAFPEPLAVTTVSGLSQTVMMKPVAMPDVLDPAHELTVTVEVAETAAQTGWVSAETKVLTGLRLVELNGRLYFGVLTNGVGPTDIPATLTGFFSPQTVTGTSSGGAFETILSSAAFTLDAEPSLGTTVGTLAVQVVPDGTAWVGAGQFIHLTSAQPVESELNGFRYFLKNDNGDDGVTLSSTGATGSLRLILPAGMGVSGSSTAQRVSPFLDFGGVVFNDQLQPVDASYSTFGAPLWVTVEDVPVRMQAPGLTWEAALGGIAFNPSTVEPVRAAAYTAIENVPALYGDPNLLIPVSNDLYYRFCTAASSITVTPRLADGAAQLTGNFTLGAGAFHAHFPQFSRIEWATGGMVAWLNGEIDGSTSEITGMSPVAVRYRVNCPDKACFGAQAEHRYAAVAPARGAAGITRDGGIWADGPMDGNPQMNAFFEFGNPFMPETRLEWGLRSNTGTFAMKAEGLVNTVFAMTGHRLAAGESSLSARQWVAVMHLSGFGDSSGPDGPERPGAMEYNAGLRHYAGVSGFADGTSSQGESIVGSTASGPYTLAGESRLYARPSGVTGVQRALSFPSSLTVYGYNFGFSQFGATFRDTLLQVSGIQGQVDLPFPAGVTLPFERLTLTCTGDVSELGVPSGSSAQRLQHWGADVKILSARMDEEGATPCFESEKRMLGLEVSAGASHFANQPLQGVLGFLPDGNVATPDDRLNGTDGFASMPLRFVSGLRPKNHMTFRGAPIPDTTPTEHGTYTVDLVVNPYLNNHRQATETGAGFGFFNIVGTMDVAFFEDLKAHIQVGGEPNSETGFLHILGGWKVASKNWFDTTEFDLNHRGYPPSHTLAVYRKGGPEVDGKLDPQYLAKARKKWFGVVDFDYPVIWNESGRNFRTPQDLDINLLVLRVKSSIPFLSSTHSAFNFGAAFSSNITANFNDMTKGAFNGQLNKKVKEAGLPWLGDVFVDMLQAVDTTLEDTNKKKAAAAITEQVDPKIEALLDQLTAGYNAATGQWNTPYQSIVSTALTISLPSGSGPTANNDPIQTKLRKCYEPATSGESFLQTVRREVLKVETGIYALTDQIGFDNAGNIVLDYDPQGVADARVVSTAPGLLKEQASGAFGTTNRLPLVGNLIQGVLAFSAPRVLGNNPKASFGFVSQATDWLDAAIADHTAEFYPTLLEIRKGLTTSRDTVKKIRGYMQNGQKIQFNLEKKATNFTNGELAGLVTNLQNDFNDILKKRSEDGQRYSDYTRDEIRTLLKKALERRFLAATVFKDYHDLVRSYTVPVSTKIGSLGDDLIKLCGKVADVLVGFLAEKLGISKAWNDFKKKTVMKGDLGGPVKAAEIKGTAKTVGDSLNYLKLDAKADLDLGKDKLNLNAFFLYETYKAKGTGSCSLSTLGGNSTEAVKVEFGTIGQPVKGFGENLKLTIKAKIDFKVDPVSMELEPIGMGGLLQRTDGKIKFSSFSVENFGAALSFGALENYFAAQVAFKISAASVAGGIFVGKTCSLDPIKLVDAEVVQIIGQPPFTGLYIYGEGSVPIYNAGCMFNITAGAGLGGFYFAEGPTYGGKVKAMVSGQALCLAKFSGKLTGYGVQRADKFSLKGIGELGAEIGPCPVCIKPKLLLQGTYVDEKWDFKVEPKL